MRLKKWLIKKISRFLEIRQVVTIPKDEELTKEEKFNRAIGKVANPDGSLPDYVRDFRALFDEVMMSKPFKLFDPGLTCSQLNANAIIETE